MCQPGLLSHSTSLPQKDKQIAAFLDIQIRPIPRKVFQAVKPKNCQTKVQHLLKGSCDYSSATTKSGGCVESAACFNGRYSIFKILLQLILSNHLIACFWFLLGDEGSIGEVPTEEVSTHASWVDALQLKDTSVAYQLLASVVVPVGFFRGFVLPGILGSFRALCSHSKYERVIWGLMIPDNPGWWSRSGGCSCFIEAHDCVKYDSWMSLSLFSRIFARVL